MDPAADVLTIYPAAWAALFQGLAEGLVYGLVGMASAAVIGSVLASILGQGRAVRQALDDLSGHTTSATADIGVIAPAVYHPVRQRGRRRRA